MPITSTGIGTGLDVEALVSQLVLAETKPTNTRLNVEETNFQAKLSAYGSLKGALASFQSSLANASQLSTYQSRSATSSDNDALTASAGSDSASATYSIDVNQLATSHTLASEAFTATTDQVGTGTLTFRFGTTDYNAGTDTYNSFALNPDTEQLSITIDSSNNTVTGIRDAINDSDAGISASIINDGSGFRLLISTTATGAANSLEIVTDDLDLDDTDNLGLSRLAFNSAATQMEQTTASVDALFSINGLAVTSDSNTVTETIDDLTINLKSVTASPVTLTISQSSANAKAAISTFVQGYNQLVDTFNNLSSYNAESKEASLLLGDPTLRNITDRIRRTINDSVDFSSGSLSTLAELGITTNADDTLSINQATLDAAVAEDILDVAGVFASLGRIDDSNTKFIVGSGNTTPGQYFINITSLASKGSFTGTSVLPTFPTPVVIDTNNDNFTLDIDGVTGGEITLTTGSYTSGAALAAELQTQINLQSEFAIAGVSVKVGYDSNSNSFTITSNKLGSSSSIEFTAVDSNTASALGFTIANGTDGADLAGTINGEAATSNDNVLTASFGTKASGLAIEILGGSTGLRGPITYTSGITDQLSNLIDSLLQEDGLLTARTEGISNSIDDITDQREILFNRIAALEIRYRNQFNGLELLVAQLNTTSTFLTAALAGLPEPLSFRK